MSSVQNCRLCSWNTDNAQYYCHQCQAIINDQNNEYDINTNIIKNHLYDEIQASRDFLLYWYEIMLLERNIQYVNENTLLRYLLQDADDCYECYYDADDDDTDTQQNYYNDTDNKYNCPESHDEKYYEFNFVNRYEGEINLLDDKKYEDEYDNKYDSFINLLRYNISNGDEKYNNHEIDNPLNEVNNYGFDDISVVTIESLDEFDNRSVRTLEYDYGFDDEIIPSRPRSLPNLNSIPITMQDANDIITFLKLNN